MTRRAEIEARLAASHKIDARPWIADHSGPFSDVYREGDGGAFIPDIDPPDADLIANTRPDLRWLLDELARVEGERDAAVHHYGPPQAMHLSGYTVNAAGNARTYGPAARRARPAHRRAPPSTRAPSRRA